MSSVTLNLAVSLARDVRPHTKGAALLVLNTLILVVLPFGTAILFGALTERWAGAAISGWCSVAGMFVGGYLVHRAFEFTIVAHEAARYGS